VAAICHGVVLAARSTSAKTGKSVLYGRRTTALTWKLERSAWLLSRYAGRWWDRDYYRTYREQAGEPSGYRSVQAEVTRALARPEDFFDVPGDASDRFRKARWTVPRYAVRRSPGLRRARRQLFVGTLARRRAHIRAHVSPRCSRMWR
jgi:hypothetical protein